MNIPDEWTFHSEEVAGGFDNHVREQLPWYDLLTASVAYIGRNYIPAKGLVYDIGASTGNIGRAIAPYIGTRDAELVAIEESEAMSRLYQGPGKLVVADALDYDFKEFDLAICFLVLMFFPPAKRAEFIQNLKDKMRPGGAIIIVDKCEAPAGYPATVMARLSLSHKIAAGVKPGEVVAKELSLCGVQRPIDPGILGPGAVPFFRFGEFAGWLLDYYTLQNSR